MSIGVASVNLALVAAITQSLGGSLGSAQYPANFAPAQNQSLSVHASNANSYTQCVAQGRTVTSGTPDAINLSSGLKQPDSSNFVCVDIVAIGIKNNGIAGQTLSLGAGTGAVTSILGATGVLTILPGATFILFCPAAAGSTYQITASTADKLQATVAAGTNVPYDFVLFSH